MTEEVMARIGEIKARCDAATAGPWVACGTHRYETQDGKCVPVPKEPGDLACKCGTVWCGGDDSFPVAEATGGKWGDPYPAIRIKEGIPGEIRGELLLEAYDELIEYGEVGREEQSANMKFIAESRSDIPWLLALVESLLNAGPEESR